jgi:hypothetical protein
MSTFMQKQVTEYMEWIAIDGNHGTTYVPADEDRELRKQLSRGIYDEQRAATYYEGTKIDTVSLVNGHGARMSAPGYMDCTDWTIFDTPEEAERYLDEYYGDDEDFDEEAPAPGTVYRDYPGQGEEE